MTAETERFLRSKEVYTMIGISEANFYRMLRSGRFPAGLRLGPSTIRWRLSLVKGWMAEQSS